ncbi:hypothetical protein F5Y10DRAFT_40747 [Nemania abortiva]|nr:hypothetical protein F5Y10DRAFT_40747 [Nemania abortiva]
MATGNDENPDNGPQNPFAYVLIPVIGFGLIVSVITCYRYRRRKARLAQFAADPSAQLEAGRTRVDRGLNGVTIVATAGGRSGNAGGGGGRRGRSRRLGLGVGVGSREEGLNELGEAPPAYTPDAPKPPTPTPDGGIELTTYSQATAEAGTSRSPPSYDEERAAGTRTETETTGGAAETVGTDESRREDTTENATTTTTATMTTTASTTPTGTTAATSATTEPTPPPRAVLPSS